MNDNLHARALQAGLDAVEKSLSGSSRPRKGLLQFITQLEDAVLNMRTMADVVREQSVRNKDPKLEGEAHGIDRAAAIFGETLEKLGTEYLNLGGVR